MSVNWTSPLVIPGAVAMGLQTLLSRANAFELTADNLARIEELNAESRVILDAETREVASLEPLIGFQWSWGSRG